MPSASIPGRTLVTRRAIAEEVRRVAVSSYGVVTVGDRRVGDGLLDGLTRSVPGVRIRTDPQLVVDVQLTIAPGLPVGQVAKNVSDQVRYALRTTLGRDPADVRIHVDRVRAPGRPAGSSR